ncbi:nuclear envelope integral membrane protein 2 isoform X2 [Denticeps clupeoides]|uniref:nuclear envelope integral membrane protein 2 isoform X2 n=1 Tax=Denticeps clupeoides TaxID=299321 RepID=UPI0010A34D93|nr:nuclear envelope integral membrane protein 2 isoform X2 [Denticeps clupeoides]
MRTNGVYLFFGGLVFILCPSAFGNKGYPHCTYLKGNTVSTHYGGRCFCYCSGTGIKLADLWSTFQVSVASRDDAFILYPLERENCHNPDNVYQLAKCAMENYWPFGTQRGKTLDIPLVDEDVCFMVQSPTSSSEYTVQVTSKRLNKRCFGLFVSGVVLFFLAGVVCRSSLFYYTSGVSLGIVSIFLLLLLLLKSFVPKKVQFLMLFGTSLSYLGVQKAMLEWNEILREYWREVLGYLLISGVVSFAACYKHGPITCQRTLTLMTWCIRAVAVVMLYCGITYPLAAHTLLGLLLVLRFLSCVVVLLCGICRRTWLLLCSFARLFQRRRPKTRLLTEEEYREQGEVYTKFSLEELREYCKTPGFPAWDTVLKLNSPQRFAEFLRGASHVNPTEMQTHEMHYGLGGAYYEDLLFRSDHERHSQQTGDGDISDDELETCSQGAQSTPNSVPPLLPPSSAPTYNAPLCPYPPLPYTPQYEPPIMEDPDLF